MMRRQSWLLKSCCFHLAVLATDNQKAAAACKPCLWCWQSKAPLDRRRSLGSNCHCCHSPSRTSDSTFGHPPRPKRCQALKNDSSITHAQSQKSQAHTQHTINHFRRLRFSKKKGIAKVTAQTWHAGTRVQTCKQTRQKQTQHKRRHNNCHIRQTNKNTHIFTQTHTQVHTHTLG